MKRIYIIFSLLVLLSTQYSCQKPQVPEAGFKDQFKYSIDDYLVSHEAEYSSFLKILQVSGLDKTLSGYNPGGVTGGVNYTLFLPDNKAVDDFINSSNGEYASLDALLQDSAFCVALAKYHILNQGMLTIDFPFGTFSQPTLSNDLLNVNFDVQPDTTFYKINNEAKVIKANIETSNGYIQVIGTMLKPITLNSYGWLKKNPGYTIFTAALEATGTDLIINVDMKLKDQTLKPFTMLVEPDSVYNKANINSLDDLIKLISPTRSDYTIPTNPLNAFVNYHLLTGSYFLSDLAKENTNLSTMADIPIRINGTGLDMKINESADLVFVEKYNTKDTTHYVGIYYDQSNINTQSGPIHFINQILMPWIPPRAEQNYGFYEEPLLWQYSLLGGTFNIKDQTTLPDVTFSGEQLSYVKSMTSTNGAWSDDYMLIVGDFTVTYTIPKIIQGKYDLYIVCENYNSQNAVVEVYVDGKKTGDLVDMTKGTNATWPWAELKVGTINFTKYERHAIQVRALIPGMFKWDLVRFKPI